MGKSTMTNGNKTTKETSRLGYLIYGVALAMAFFQLYSSAVRTITPILLQNIHIAFAYSLIFLTAIYKAARSSHPLIKRVIYATLLVISLVATTYIHLNYDNLIMNVGMAGPVDILIGILLVIVTLESTRSSFGLPIVILTLVCIAYMFAGPHLPGILYHGGFSLRRVVSTLTISFGGMYGSLLGVSATFLALFMLFGGILGKSGAGEFFMDLAMGIGGKTKAGPALAAVISSGLMGSINGSAVANVATTGTFTIPMMKDRGYEPEFAGAVEATASTGGMLLPPVMGVGAFIMAELTGISYGRICVAALIPALLYYLLCGAAVIFHSNKLNLKKMNAADIPSVGRTFKKGFYYLIPIVVIVYYMSQGYSVTKSAIAGITTQIAIIILKAFIGAPSNLLRLKCWKPLLDGLVDGIQSVIGVAVTLACVGMMVDCIVSTGLAHRLVIMVLTIGKNDPLMSLIITMLIALFFGMGVPTTASYILLATMAAPALVEAGLPLLPVHLFCYYFTIIGSVTPPVGNAAIVASRMAGANYNKTCYYAVLLALSGFLLPFLFVFRPELLMQGDILAILDVTLTCTLGLLALAAFFERWLLISTTLPEQIVLFAAASMLIYPSPLWLSAIGVALVCMVIVFQRKKRSAIAGI
jgi:TRAP transporter 4TM/12TM fusion protein